MPAYRCDRHRDTRYIATDQVFAEDVASSKKKIEPQLKRELLMCVFEEASAAVGDALNEDVVTASLGLQRVMRET